MKKSFLLTLALISIGCSIGCSTSQTKEERSLAEKMNGQTYESSNAVMSVPVLNPELPAQRKISGQVVCGEGLSQVPIHNALITLKDGDKVLSTGSSDIKGQYAVLTKLKKGKQYQLLADAKCGKSEKRFSWNGEPEIENQDFILGPQK